MVMHQVEIGMVNKEDLTENFKVENSWLWMAKQVSMWIELILMFICPVSFDDNKSWVFHQRIVYIETINWIEPSGAINNAQGHKYETPYFMTDFFLAFMLFRLFFLAQAMIINSHVNEKLHGKRVCQEAGFQPTFSFQLKAAMKATPILTFLIMAAILILGLSYMTRVFERPYFRFVFNNEAEGFQTFYNFDTLTSSLWFTIITMSSVGYGNIISTTPLGRFVTIIIAISGAFLLSLLVAIITDWFVMAESQTDAIEKMEKDKCAVDFVKCGLRFNAARKRRYRLLESGNEDGEYVPS